MEEFFILILAAAIVFVVAVVCMLIRDNRMVSRAIRREGFTNARVYRHQFTPACAAFDDSTRRALFISENRKYIIPYSRLIDAQPFVYTGYVDRESKPGVIGSAILGDTIAGQKGAIIGAMAAASEKPRRWTEKRYNRIGVEITYLSDPKSGTEDTLALYFLGDSRADAKLKADAASVSLANDYIRYTQQITDEVQSIAGGS